VSATQNGFYVVSTDGRLLFYDGWQRDGGPPDHTLDRAMDNIAVVSHTIHGLINEDGGVTMSGGWFTMALDNNNVLWAWGDNRHGQLDNNSTSSATISNPVRVLDDVVTVSAGAGHTLAIRTNGSLWSWGDNGIGALGDGTTTNRHTPVWVMDGISLPQRNLESPATTPEATIPAPISPEPLGNIVQVSNENELRTAVWQAGNTPVIIELTSDIELISNFYITDEANITLTSEGEGSFTLLSVRDMDVITLQDNVRLVIENISISRSAGTSGRGINVDSRSATVVMNNSVIHGHSVRGSGAGIRNLGEFTMNSGSINNNLARGHGGGVYNSGRFTINSGEITENTAQAAGATHHHGGGINNSGTFVMNDGTISNNVVLNVGDFGMAGGVNNTGTFVMRNGTITGHSTRNAGGGVRTTSSFTMHGGSILNNTSERGGSSVHVDGGNFTVYEGIIGNNVSVARGEFILDNGEIAERVSVSGTFIMNNGSVRGVSNSGQFTMNGGTISYSNDWGIINTRTLNIYNGTITNNNGGIRNERNGTFTLSEGLIYGNISEADGGGILNMGTFNMVGGLIHSNSANARGGGVGHMSGTFTFDAGWIFNNNANDGDDIHIAQGGIFNNNVWDGAIGAIGVPPAGFIAP